MKKQILSSVFLLLSVIFVNAQLIKQFDCSTQLKNIVTSPQSGDLNYQVENVVKFYTTKKDTEQGFIITIYNYDFSIYKTITIPTSFSNVGISFATTKFFNSDDKIEFVFYSTNDYITYNTLLYNEDKDIIHDFGNEYVSGFAKSESGNNILITYTNPGNGPFNYHYYLIGLQTNNKNVKSLSKLNNSPYPNPAAQTINLPYQLNSGEQADMQIYDVNGKLVATKRIDAAFDKIVLNVSGYEKGMYVYKYNGKSAKFVVE